MAPHGASRSRTTCVFAPETTSVARRGPYGFAKRHKGKNADLIAAGWGRWAGQVGGTTSESDDAAGESDAGEDVLEGEDRHASGDWIAADVERLDAYDVEGALEGV